MSVNPRLKVSLAQISPVWLDRAATLEKVADSIQQAGAAGSQLIAFGEALVPGYPFWPELTNGAQFDSAMQKDLFAHYSSQAVDIEAGDLQGKYFDHGSYATVAAGDVITITATANGTEAINGTVILTHNGLTGVTEWTGTLLD